MGNSSTTLQQVLDTIVSQGIPDPRNQPGGFGNALVLELANTVFADLIAGIEKPDGTFLRFNWKWNRAVAAPFYTNSWQQDYPQPAQTGGNIGWGEDCDIIDINNTVLPKPLWNMTWRRQLSRTNTAMWRPGEICWMYNADLYFGSWPGAGVTYYPLVTSGPISQNPLMSMVDANGNLLIVTGFGTTGPSAPSLPANSAEGLTVVDGSVTWSVVSPTSQGFRLNRLPNATGPTYKIIPVYQLDPPPILKLGQLLNPIPDSYIRHFHRGMTAACLAASADPNQAKRGQAARMEWAVALKSVDAQGDKEMNVYRFVPQTQVVEHRWDELGPYSADQPY